MPLSIGELPRRRRMTGTPSGCDRRRYSTGLACFEAIASMNSAGTWNDSATVLPVPLNWTDCIRGCIPGLLPACILARARKPWTTSRRFFAASSSRASARSLPLRPPLMWLDAENQ